MQIVRNLLFIGLAILAFLYWFSKYDTAKETLPKDRYSADTLEGVRLSKYQDLRGVRGTLNMQHEFANYLEKSTTYLSQKYGTRFFNAGKNFPEWMSLYSNVKSFDVLPLSNESFLLGFNKQTKFKIVGSREVLKASKKLVGLEVKLTNKHQSYYGIIKKLHDDEVYIEGYFPHDFFPDKLTVLTIGTPKSFKYMIESNNLGWVRGGTFELDVTGRTLLFIPLPGQNVNEQQIRINDKIELPNGKTLLVKNSFQLGHYTLVTISSELFEPYYDTRRNIVTVKRDLNLPQRQIMFDINQTTDSQYLFGKQRHFQVWLSDSEYAIETNSLLSVDSGNFPYFVNRRDGNLLTIDLLKSFIFDSCEKDVFIECLQDVEDMVGNIYDSPSYRTITESLGRSLESLNSETKDRKDGPSLDMYESWFRGGSLSVNANSDSSKNKLSEEYLTQQEDDNESSLKNGIWEIYPGSLLNVFYNSYNPAPTEMLIHVLGQDSRAEYYRSFQSTKPRLVSFAKPERFSPWLMNWHWPVFKYIFRHYSIAVNTNEFVLLEKRDQDWNIKESFSSLGKGLPTVISNLHNVQNQCEMSLYTVRVEYKSHNALVNLPLIGKTTRYFVDITNTGFASTTPISLPWSESVYEFPVIAMAGSEPELSLRTTSKILDSTKLEVFKVSYLKEDVPQSLLRAFKFDFPGVANAFHKSCLQGAAGQ